MGAVNVSGYDLAVLGNAGPDSLKSGRLHKNGGDCAVAPARVKERRSAPLLELNGARSASGTLVYFILRIRFRALFALEPFPLLSVVGVVQLHRFHIPVPVVNDEREPAGLNAARPVMSNVSPPAPCRNRQGPRT